MTNTEERLRAALRAEAESVPVRDSGWDRIEDKAVASVRRRRTRMAGVTALAIAAVVTLVFGLVQVLGHDDKPQRVHTVDEPQVPTTAAPAVLATSFWSGHGTPEQVARSFAKEFVGMPDPAIGTYADHHVAVRPSTGAGPTTVVHLEPGASPDEWLVVGAASDNLRVTSPAAYTTVSSPLDIVGQTVAFEGRVQAEIREDGQKAGQSIGHTAFTGGGTELAPVHVTMVYDPPKTRAGAVMLTTRSARDGSIVEATVIRVGFAAPPNAPTVPTRFVAVARNGRIALGRTADGSFINSIVDNERTDAGSLVGIALAGDRAYVATRNVGCKGAVDEFEVHGSTVVSANRSWAAPSASPDTSPDGKRVAMLLGGPCPLHVMQVVDVATNRMLYGWTWMHGSAHGATAVETPTSSPPAPPAKYVPPPDTSELVQLAWAPDGRHLALLQHRDDGNHVLLIDTKVQQDAADEVEIPASNGTIQRVGWVADRLVVATGRGMTDAVSGATLFDTQSPITSFHTDATGTWVLVTTADGDLSRIDARGSGAPVKVATGITDADW